MRPKVSAALAALALTLTFAAPSPGQDRPGEERLVTREYPIADLVSNDSLDVTAGQRGAVPGKERPARIVELLWTTTRFDQAPDAGRFIRVENGDRLVIATTQKHHEEIGDLLGALRRLQDVSVSVQAALYEVEADVLTQRFPDAPGRRGVVTGRAKLGWLKQARPLVRADRVTVLNGQDKQVLSLEHTFGYRARYMPPDGLQAGVGLYGVFFRLQPVVSADRRLIRLNLTQQCTDLEALEEGTGGYDKTQPVTVDMPRWSKSSAETTHTLEEGQVLVLPVRDLPAKMAAAGRAYVLAVRPTVRVREEAVTAEEKSLRDDR